MFTSKEKCKIIGFTLMKCFGLKHQPGYLWHNLTVYHNEHYSLQFFWKISSKPENEFWLSSESGACITFSLVCAGPGAVMEGRNDILDWTIVFTLQIFLGLWALCSLTSYLVRLMTVNLIILMLLMHWVQTVKRRGELYY